MNCSKCGSPVQPGAKFCGNCGAPAASSFCPNCGTQVDPGAAFCANCGTRLQAGSPAAAAPQPQGTAPVSKNMPAGESVIMDTGAFPIAYIKSIMSSINGKLSLTNNYLVFKAGHLQGVGGMASGGLFIPNPGDANKSKEHFSITLASVTAVEKGWSHITVTAGGQKYKFGGMTKTGEWEQAINNARGS
jgi:hypothetical protein